MKIIMIRLYIIMYQVRLGYFKLIKLMLGYIKLRAQVRLHQVKSLSNTGCFFYTHTRVFFKYFFNRLR